MEKNTPRPLIKKITQGRTKQGLQKNQKMSKIKDKGGDGHEETS
ncbi:MAG: hypothetical protein ACE5EB_06405 [Thermodesulfobacteriota bacterium]